jgi:hypothetical protein
MLAAALLLVGSPMPETAKVMTQIKRGTLVLQVGGLGVGLTTPPRKMYMLRNFNQSLGKGKCLD